MIYKEIIKPNFKVEIEEPELYVDNKSRRRSGHMSHAMAEFAPGRFIDFNSNCSAERWGGHSPYGWVEYRISEDNGKTYSPIKTLQYSVECFLDGIHTISVEKAVACDDGAIVAFCLRNDATDQYCCEPWSTPMVVRSYDRGETWTEAEEYSPYEGRTYDALYKDGVDKIKLLESGTEIIVRMHDISGKDTNPVLEIAFEVKNALLLDENGETLCELGGGTKISVPIASYEAATVKLIG